ncbi:Chitin synthase, class 1 [Tulasnella sp. 330]|nr:Chitin synthase, class 1 [Tulasnella sp. 330]KAG8885794.1 Chitin synthase, class 1 [Tulasnella sp. 331]KAG8890367.1 Chitin synthase, class 1 [Tulasnella sp. 332]
MANGIYATPYDSNVPLPTSRAPPTRQPTKSNGHQHTASLKRGKTLTRPERSVAPAPLINPPAIVPPQYPGGPSTAAANAAAASAAVGQSIWEPWSLYAHLVTFWAPPFILSALGGFKDRQARQAWREKVALCSIALVLGGIVGFATMGLDRVFCPSTAATSTNSYTRVGSTPGTLSVEGLVLNISQSLTTADVNFYTLASQSAGQDITNLFKRSATDFTSCKGMTFAAATDDPCAASSSCQLGAPTVQTLQSLKLVQTGSLTGFDWDQVATFTTYFVIDGYVLNLTPYMEAHPKPIANDPIDAAIRTALVNQSPTDGKDATRLFTYRSDLKAAVPCLTERYFAGRIDKITPGCFISALFLYSSLIVILGVVLVRFAMACVFNWFLSSRLIQPPKNLGRTVISPAVMPEGANVAVDNKNGTAPWAGGGAPITIGGKKLHKGNVYQKTASTSPNTSSTTLVPSSSSHSNNISPNSTKAPAQPLITMGQIGAELFCVCLVTCYSEGEESLRTTCDSISTTNYSDARKLLFIVADGVITGEGEKRSTPDICIGMLDQDPRFGTPIPMGYVAVGGGAKMENRAMVYAGHYTVAGRHTPALVIVKCGTEAEAKKEKKPGNRGKRDSQLILMNFFSRVTYNDRMTPLDFDLFRKIQVLMGVTPDFFEVCLMVDADTKVYPDSVKHLVNCMQHDNLIMGVCGETRIANKRQSWVTAIQVYEYFISHHLAKAFESVFGGVTCLPGCFSMYRLKARKVNDDDWIPLITKPEIVKEYSQSNVVTLHQKNLLLLGEDRFLTTILLRTFPNRKMMFCPQALCRTVAPDTFAVLLSQRRRWINSTIHNLMELVRVRNLCGTFCFSMQFVVFMDLIGTTVLPVAICLTYTLVVNMALNPPDTFEKAIPLMLLCAVIGLPAVLILITTRKVVYVFWMLIYLMALPIWNFVLPLYAFWHFDDFSWGETRRVAGEGASKAHDEDKGTFDGSTVPMRRWEDWERSRLRKLKREEKRKREMERAYPRGYQTDPMNGGQPTFLRPFTSYTDGGSDYEGDTNSIVSSVDDDQWGTQIGGYNENGSMFPAPPATLHSPARSMVENAQTLGKDELEAMLEQGWDDPNPPPVPPLPAGITQNNAPRYQLSDERGGGGHNTSVGNPRNPTPSSRNITSPISPLVTPNGSSSAIDGERRTHMKKRSGSKTAGSGGSHDYGPLGPLGPSGSSRRL